MNNNAISLSATINRSLNTITSATSYILEKGDVIIAPAVLAYVGGWLTGVGSQIGIFQGTVSGIYYIVIHKPCANYIKKNEGKNPDNLQPETVKMLNVVGVIAEIAVPIVLTSYCGSAVTTKALSYLEEGGMLKWILTSTPSRSYTWMMGLLVNIAPTVCQHFISAWREEDEASKKRAYKSN